MRVFIVFGQTGEYSDRTDWPVRGFMTREKAEAFEFEATKWAKGFTDSRGKFYAVRDEEKPAHDPGFRHDYTGTDYYTIEVEVEP